MPSTHARLSPSAADRWLLCPGSVALCESVVEAPSTYADDGTACHELLERHLNGIPTVIGFKAANGIVTTKEHHRLVRPVLEWLIEYRQEHEAAFFAEQRIEIGSTVFGLPEGAMFGTADVVALSKSELMIFDAKFGYVEVSVKDNPQLLCYAAGALALTGWMHERVRLVIAQPKVSETPKEMIYTSAEVSEWVAKNEPAVLEAFHGGPLRPSEAACKWCKAQAVCPALKDEMMALAQREMADPLTLTPDDIADLLNKGEMIENALRALRAHAIKLMELGTDIPGYKRVVGDKHRAWKADEDVVARNLAILGVDPWQKELRSPAQMETQLAEKLVGTKVNNEPVKTKKRAKELAREIVMQYAHKPPGEPTLVRADDPRPSLPPAFTAEEVKQLDNENLID